MSIRAIHGDCRDVLKTLPDESVHCVVCSPPYFGLRDYGTGQWEGGDPACGHLMPANGVRDKGRDRAASNGKFHDSPIPNQITQQFSRECGHCGARRTDSQIGLEATPDAYVAELVAVFREVRRVLRSDGTCWINLGDSYAANRSYQVSQSKHQAHDYGSSNATKIPPGLKQKDLLGIPWMVAFALRADGWYLRSEIIWAKPNPMPESVRDRPTKAHEQIFLLSKSPRYFYDAEAIAEPISETTVLRWGGPPERRGPNGLDTVEQSKPNGKARTLGVGVAGRNKRSVWEVATQPFPGSHFATFPPALIEPCIKAGCPAKACAKCGKPWVREVERTAMVIDRSERTHALGHTRSSGTMLEPAKALTLGFSPSCSCNAATVPGVCLDPFSGAGTTGLVADRLGRDAILIELNEDYSGMSRRRITDDAPLFAEVLA